MDAPFLTCMASSGIWQSEPNPALWLATQVDKMGLSCHSRLLHVVNLLLTISLFSQDGWILVFFVLCVIMDLNCVLVHKHLSQYAAI